MMMMEWKWLWFIRMAVLLLVLEGCRWCTTDACLEHERIALLHLKPFFNYGNPLKSWVDLKGSDCCKWERVKCNTITRRVIQLSLNSTKWEYNMDYWYLNASMFLPFEKLKSLYLSENAIGGNLENEGRFGKLSSTLSNLEILDLSYNHLNDSILLSLSELSSLRYLDLSHNRFEGSSHPRGKLITNYMVYKSGFQWLSRLTKLETLYLSGNSLKNSIMVYMRNLSSLKTLSLRYNLLEGKLIHTQEWNNLTNLKYLDLSYNNIESISNQGFQWLSRLTKLETLNLSGNSLKNSILFDMRNLSSLKTLRLSSNQLEGRLLHIQELNNLTNLNYLDLSGNRIESISNKDGGRKLELTHLKELNLNSNLFNNSVFASLNKLLNLKTLSISNQLKGPIDAKDLDAFTSLRELNMRANELIDFVIHK
ncbi:hypothetical protein Gogos_011306, partial [Gossypium gossypioides]|nr:hypothetical protein [Gossypium gossypioides]